MKGETPCTWIDVWLIDWLIDWLGKTGLIDRMMLKIGRQVLSGFYRPYERWNSMHLLSIWVLNCLIGFDWFDLAGFGWTDQLFNVVNWIWVGTGSMFGVIWLIWFGWIDRSIVWCCKLDLGSHWIDVWLDSTDLIWLDWSINCLML